MFPVLTVPSPSWARGLGAPASAEMSPGGAWVAALCAETAEAGRKWGGSGERCHGQRQPCSVSGRHGRRTAGGPAFLERVPPTPGPRVVDTRPSARRACLPGKTPACAAEASSLPASALSPGSHRAPWLRSSCPRWFTFPGSGRVPRPVKRVLRWVSRARGSSSVMTSRPSLDSLLSPLWVPVLYPLSRNAFWNCLHSLSLACSPPGSAPAPAPQQH